MCFYIDFLGLTHFCHNLAEIREAYQNGKVREAYQSTRVKEAYFTWTEINENLLASQES